MLTGKKDSTLLIKINGDEKRAFIELCEQSDTSASREIRRFIREYLVAEAKNSRK